MTVLPRSAVLLFSLLLIGAAWAQTENHAANAGARPSVASPRVPRKADAPPLTTQEVVERMGAMNAARQEALEAFKAERSYHLEYHGLGHDSASMHVAVTYDDPGPMKLSILSESGSDMLQDPVLEPLIQVEQHEAQIAVQDGGSITPENYTFKMVQWPKPGESQAYVLEVTPKHKNAKRFVFKGRIWINSKDFGVERVEGDSVHSPSFWVSNFHFSYRAQKIGDFWMPASNHCVSKLRFLGHAVLDITYFDFELTSAHPVSYVAAMH